MTVLQLVLLIVVVVLFVVGGWLSYIIGYGRGYDHAYMEYAEDMNEVDDDA